MDKPWKVVFAFLGVFMAGAVFGGLFTLRASAKRFASELELSRATPPPPAVVVKESPTPGPAAAPAQAATPPAAKATPTPQDRNVIVVMRQLIQRVSPTSDQQKAMRIIVARATEDLQRLQREHWQDTTRVTERMYEDLGAVLSPEQRTQLEKMRQEMLERVRNAKEKQRLEAQSRAVARPNPGNPPPAGNRKAGSPEAANPGP